MPTPLISARQVAIIPRRYVVGSLISATLAALSMNVEQLGLMTSRDRI